MTVVVVTGALGVLAVAIAAFGLRALYRDPGGRASDPVPRVGASLRHHYGTLDSDPGWEKAPGAPWPAAAPPVLHHDEYAPAQRWHPEPVTITRCPLPPVTGPAVLAIAALTAPVRAHLEEAEQARREALKAEALAVFPEWQPWPGDGTLTSMRAVT